MANSQVINEIVQGLKLDRYKDTIPNVIPVLEVNPKLVKNGLVETTTSSVSESTRTLLTPITDIYIHSISMDFIKDATCDCATGIIAISAITESGISKNLLRIPILTLTQQTGNHVEIFNAPLKIKAGNAITMTLLTYTAGSFIKTATINYSTDEIN